MLDLGNELCLQIGSLGLPSGRLSFYLLPSSEYGLHI
jgi:hypothetical protein